MGRSVSDVIIHVTEPLDEAGVCGVERELCDLDGVVSARHSPGRNHLLMVVYDTATIPSINLLTPAKTRGLHAQLIGL